MAWPKKKKSVIGGATAGMGVTSGTGQGGDGGSASASKPMHGGVSRVANQRVGTASGTDSGTYASMDDDPFTPQGKTSRKGYK